MWKTGLLIVLLSCTANTAFSQLQQVPQPIPLTPLSAPAAVNGDDKLTHLRQAAEHLEAAGLKDEAERIRRMIKTEDAPQVSVKLTLIEISLTKLRKLGFSFAKVIPDSPPDSANAVQENSVKDYLLGNSSASNGGCAMLKEDDKYFSVLDVLVTDRIGRVLTAPRITTVSGQEAQIRIGSEIPQSLAKHSDLLPKAYKKLGASFTLRPVALDGETVHLDIRGSFSELNEKHRVKIEGISVPVIKTREITTTCNIKNGQVFVIRGLVEQRLDNKAPGAAANAEKYEKSAALPVQAKVDGEELTLLLLVRAAIVEPNRQMATKPHSASLLE